MYTEVTEAAQQLKYWCDDVPHVFAHVLVVDPTHRPHPMLGDLEVLVSNCRSKRLLSMPRQKRPENPRLDIYDRERRDRSELEVLNLLIL